MKLKIGSRGSKLALVQTEAVRARLVAAYPDLETEIVVISTRGDRVTDRPIAAIGDNALFTREIETALLERRIDLAVHSMKDLPAECREGLVLARAWKREDPRDVLVARDRNVRSLADLPEGAVVATGSARRNVLLRQTRPDLGIVDIRGNVDTRLRKLFEPAAGEPRLDAIVLAAAGLVRLGRTDVVSAFLDDMLPAANQGQLALEVRADDLPLREMLDALSDSRAELVATAERAFLRELRADCRAPVGAFAAVEPDGRIRLRAVYARTEADEPAFAEVTAGSPSEAGRLAAVGVRRRAAGRVVLVGAGPGDPDLITVRGLSLLRGADAVVYDRLASPKLLETVKPGCELVYAGKASGDHAMAQDEINRLLAALAMRHACVVRLKGGDPFVLGRGGEELEYLADLGIRTETVPGVTSAVAAAEAVRIPVTHRSVASGFTVVTAHAKNDEPLALDFGALPRDRHTLVFLMGLARVAEIAAGLVAAGRSPATPAAVVSSATTSDERLVTGVLGDIAGRVSAAGLRSPAVMIVGETVRLRSSLGLPLAGRRYLVPVIEGGSRSLAPMLRALGAETVEPVVGRIEAIPDAVRESDLDGIDRIVFTSRNGRLGLTDRVREWIDARGIRLEDVREIVPDGRTLHLTQPDADRVPGVRSVDVYRNVELDPGPVDLGGYDGALFTCASSVRRIYAVARGDTRAFAIGRKTAAALESAGAKEISVSAHCTLESLVESVLYC